MTAKTPFSPQPAEPSSSIRPEAVQRRFQTECTLDGRLPNAYSIHQTEEATLRPPSQKSAHWSIAWSDLMMTMFILFLSLFVYQAAHKDFLISDEHEVVAGDTREAVEPGESSGASFPFAAITPAAPLITSGTVKKVEPITLQEIHLDEAFSDADMDKTLEELARVIPSAESLMRKKERAPAGSPDPAPAGKHQGQIAAADSKANTTEAAVEEVPAALPAAETDQEMVEKQMTARSGQKSAGEVFARTEKPGTGTASHSADTAETVSAAPQTVAAILQPQPLEIKLEEEPGSVNEIFSKSKKTLDVHNLGKFASIDLVPDKAVRIVLTGDLLFETGHAALSRQAIDSLEKIAEVIRQTQHTVHIEGHTDDVPIFAGRYANNWELSIARANAVANFLIEDMDMEPQQFVISGFSSYKPIAPNTTAENRAANRRVEIVIAQPQSGQEIAFRETTNRAYQTL